MHAEATAPAIRSFNEFTFCLGRGFLTDEAMKAKCIDQIPTSLYHRPRDSLSQAHMIRPTLSEKMGNRLSTVLHKHRLDVTEQEMKVVVILGLHKSSCCNSQANNRCGCQLGHGQFNTVSAE